MKKLLLSFITLTCLASATSAQSTVYVDIDAVGSNNGVSWADAFNTLQEAIDSASVGDEIWIATGTYYPTTDINGNIPSVAQDKVLKWDKDLSILGGFNGTETSSSQRNWNTNVVTLSGDIGIQGSSVDNIKLIISIRYLSASPSVLDGVTISDANGVFSGDGAFIISSCPNFTIKNCVIAHNYNVNTGTGSISSSIVYIDNSTFHHNSSGDRAGAIYVAASTLIATNSAFHHNSSVAHGGNIIFDGSGINPSLFSNCLFYNNTAGSIIGGALHFYNSSQVAKIYNCTFANNNAPTGSSVGVYLALVDIRNSIFYGLSGNTELEDYNGNGSSFNVQNSIVKGGYATGTNIITSYPEFLDSTNYDFTLQNTSPAINVGDTNGISIHIPTSDLANQNRYYGSDIDLGCYEHQGTSVGVDESRENKTMLVYPNPASDQLTIENGESIIESILVIDITGKTVKTIIPISSTINVSELVKGIYFLQAQTENGIMNSKFIKE